ncbi:putative NADH-cytochrome b5 reductase [Trypanosoma cruzi]|uniref:Reductase, putative n=1 Tax=Trypanosoma cruzi (strain CL Brener) TaxID=353153 RepID=Q4DL41_TRYCC|nr:reductase, putative [Trypanosoma cruzi]EAN93238.1 reductase, putative [Trypanosoma cruzi]RNC57937.1 putative NADH-cytochrome b5 reductase [Trypanosoma cruzi]|eukprot:XP_815089.1 reductase [Trypanosoma cruzi strain CL Brener]
MRVVVSFAAGLLAALLHRPVDDAFPAECYRSIENALHFRNKKRDGEVFSQRYEPYQLGEVIPITHDTALFRFLLHADEEFNLKPCSTLQACYKYGVQPMEQCHRFYTPVTANRTKGYFDIIVKRKNSGLMTTHLFGMHVGDKLLFRSVTFKVQYKPNKWNHVGMIAGGTGFTPMLQIIRHSLMEKWNDGSVDNTKLSFLFCNRTEKHILLKGLFDDLAERYSNRFKVYYTVDQPVEPENWKHFVGYVSKEMVQQTMPAPDEKKKIIMLCGPDQLLNHVAGTPMGTMSAMSSGMNIQPLAPDLNNLVSLGGILGELGYKNDDVYRF